MLAAHPDVLYAGFLQDAQKEYAEALATRALVAGDPLPSPEDVGVGDAPYLNGLAETVGELRRHLLDVLRAGDVPRASALFAAMEEIHALLADLDYPDAITGNLRRSTDVARSIIERTRSDLTLTMIQRDLADALRQQPPAGPSHERPRRPGPRAGRDRPDEAAGHPDRGGLRRPGGAHLPGHPDLHQPFGLVHGGVYATLAETAASVAGASWFGDRGKVVGVSNHTDFLRAVREGGLRAEATPLSRGRTTQLWQVEISDDRGRLVAHAKVRLQNLAEAPGA